MPPTLGLNSRVCNGTAPVEGAVDDAPFTEALPDVIMRPADADEPLLARS
jgi:hypothetical protein